MKGAAEAEAKLKQL